ncbi:hypothetical protein FPV67DRAFT_769678 [Lyophyllum atratum]|nr:hypothetical protein FPV67DRAFT_769678 [Lyophyllum atratum]
MCTYYQIILGDIVRRYSLQLRHEGSRTRTQRGDLYTAKLYVNGLLFTRSDHDSAKAEEDVAHDAINALEGQRIHRRHYKTDLNNLVRKYRLRLNYENSHDGPADRRRHIAVAYVDGTPMGQRGVASQKTWAEELAARTVVQILENEGYRL